MNRRVSHLIAGWRTGLPRPVLILQAGNALNYFGYGLVLPFEIIYLHQIRGFSTSIAGLVLAATMRTAAFALNRVAGNFGIGSGATVAGFIVAFAQRLSSFQTLYIFDAVTYAAFALIVLAAVPSPRAETVTATDANGTGFRAVARDRLFLTMIGANIVLVVVGHTFFSNILPPFAKTHTPLGPAAIGIIVLVNTSFVVIAQIPAVRVVARMRRTHAFAAASALFAVSLLAVLPATLTHSELAATSLFTV